MEADPDLTITVYTAEAGSPSAERLGLLASWAATNEQHSVPEAYGDNTDADAVDSQKSS